MKKLDLNELAEVSIGIPVKLDIGASSDVVVVRDGRRYKQRLVPVQTSDLVPGVELVDAKGRLSVLTSYDSRTQILQLTSQGTPFSLHLRFVKEKFYHVHYTQEESDKRA